MDTVMMSPTTWNATMMVEIVVPPLGDSLVPGSTVDPLLSIHRHSEQYCVLTGSKQQSPPS